MKQQEKLIEIAKVIDESCKSAVKRFEPGKHTGLSVGVAAYEERQNALTNLGLKNPEIIEPLPKIKNRQYFKFDGQVVKIISSPLEPLGANAETKNILEQEELNLGDTLKRIIFKTSYDIDSHEAEMIECHYIEIDRVTSEVVKEIDVLSLYQQSKGYVDSVNLSKPEPVEIPPANLFGTLKKKKAENE